jgi:ADP-ribosyl-[dinitrogen reductase] hydrolase
MVKNNRYEDKSRGMLVGLAIGDALGAPVEFFHSSFEIEEMGDEITHFHKNTRAPEGVWTDDTSMALCIADSLIANGGYDSYDIMNRFKEWCYSDYRKHPQAPVDVGMQTLKALDEYETSPIIKKDAPKTESAGNGAIMRLAPIIIANTFPNKKYPTLKEAFEQGSLAVDPEDDNGEFIRKEDILPTIKMAELSCRETHDSIAACAVTEMFASVLYCLLHGLQKNNAVTYASRWIENKYDDFYYNNGDLLVGRVLKKSGFQFRDLGGYIVDTFAIAVWGLINFRSFEEGMMAVIRLGGDTDTNAACYGQLAGAYYGYKKIPEEWKKGIYLSDELVEIADELLKMPDCPVLRTRFEDEESFRSI